MTDLRDLIECEIDQYLEWPTADKSHVTTTSAKLFAEHVAQLYAESRPAPDVADLVEALERINGMDSMSYHSLESAKIVARAALVAYRKGGDTP